MRGTLRWVVLSLVIASPASAAVVRLGLGADYWVYAPGYYYWGNGGAGDFNITLAVGANVARHLQVGGRFGALITTYPNTFGVPLDLFLRANIGDGRVYLEGLVGPWILFADNVEPVRVHAAFGFGLRAGSVSFGLEVGYMDPYPSAGVRVAFAFF